MKTQLCVIAFAAVFAVPGIAQASSVVSPADLQKMISDGSAVMASRVKGRVNKGLMTLTVEAGPLATKAICVYSTPSKTPLLLAMDRDFKDSPDGTKYRTQLAGEPRAEITSQPLPGASPTVKIAAPPDGDKRIEVWVYGRWPDSGRTEERLIADARVNFVDFEFSSAVHKSAPAGDPVHCCWGGGCSQMCIECPGPRFSCCLLGNYTPPCCSITCGPGDPDCCGIH